MMMEKEVAVLISNLLTPSANSPKLRGRALNQLAMLHRGGLGRLSHQELQGLGPNIYV